MIDKSEIRRYLGIKGEADAATERLIEECANELLSSVRTAYTFKIFPLVSREDGIEIKGCDILLQGKNAAARLCGCSQCAIIGATLGIEADKIIRRVQCIDMAKAVVYDACATYLIEKLCDDVQAEVAGLAAERGLLITERFSPGYRGFPLDLQRRVCDAIEIGKKIGVFLTDELLLIPTKSVTAFIGIGRPEDTKKEGCKTCSMKGKCKYSQEEGNIL